MLLCFQTWKNDTSSISNDKSFAVKWEESRLNFHRGKWTHHKSPFAASLRVEVWSQVDFLTSLAVRKSSSKHLLRVFFTKPYGRCVL